MKKYLVMAVAAVFTLGAVATQAKADGHEVKFGFAAAETGWLQAYSGPSTSAALIAIEDINAKGGLLGKKNCTDFPRY